MDPEQTQDSGFSVDRSLAVTRSWTPSSSLSSKDLLWRDILLRVLSEAGSSKKDICDRFYLNGSFSDRAMAPLIELRFDL